MLSGLYAAGGGSAVYTRLPGWVAHGAIPPSPEPDRANKGRVDCELDLDEEEWEQ